MRRITITLLLATSLSIGTNMSANAGPSGPCLERSWIPRTGMPTAEKEWRVVRLVSCAVKRWSVPGGARYALGIAYRESHYDNFAYNASGCGGLFQHMLRYWPARVAAYLERDWFRAWPPAYTNARANTIVAIRMAHEPCDRVDALEHGVSCGACSENADCYFGDHEWQGGVCIGCGERFRCACGQFARVEDIETHMQRCPWLIAAFREPA